MGVLKKRQISLWHCVCSSKCVRILVSCTFDMSAIKVLKDKTEWHTERALQAVSSRWQHTVHRVLCTWNTGWCHLIANSEYSTCLSVFWRNKRDGGNSCGGRERGVHRTSHRGCASPAQHTIHTDIKVNMSTYKYAYEQIFIYTHTHMQRHTHTHTASIGKLFQPQQVKV